MMFIYNAFPFEYSISPPGLCHLSVNSLLSALQFNPIMWVNTSNIVYCKLCIILRQTDNYLNSPNFYKGPNRTCFSSLFHYDNVVKDFFYLYCMHLHSCFDLTQRKQNHMICLHLAIGLFSHKNYINLLDKSY